MPLARWTRVGQQSSILPRGFSGALLTTVAALCVAIPIVFAYNNLSARTRAEMSKLENFASNLADRIELETKFLKKFSNSLLFNQG